MFATTHAITGIVLTRVTANVPILFGLSFLSHIVLDLIPHGDNILLANEEKYLKSKKIRIFFLYCLIDIALTTGIFLYLISKNSLDPTLMVVAIFGALLIDLISVGYKITKWKFLAGFERWHLRLHYVFAKYLPRGDISPLTSIILQIIFIVVVLGALII